MLEINLLPTLPYHNMSGQVPSREERLRLAHESAERIKDQCANANDVYDGVRDLTTVEDPQIRDLDLPEAVEGRSAEMISLEEEARAWQKEIKQLKEQNVRYEQEIERIGKEMQSSQLSDEEPEEIILDRLQQLKRLIENHPKLAALLFEDKAIFEPAIQSMKTSGNQLLSKLHSVHEEVKQLSTDIRDARLDYHARLDGVVKPLQEEVVKTRKELESAEVLQSTTNTELENIKEALSKSTEQHQALANTLRDKSSELKNTKETLDKSTEQHQALAKTLRDEISELKNTKETLDKSTEQHEALAKTLRDEISKLKTEATTAFRQSVAYQREIRRLMAHEVTIRYLATEIETVVSENVQAKARNTQLEGMLSQQDGQHKAEMQAMITAKNNLSARNDRQEAEIEILQSTMKELEEGLSEHIDQLQVQVQELLADKNSLSTQITQYKTEIHGLEAARDYALGQVARSQGQIDDLDAAKGELANQNTQCQVRIRILEAEKSELTDRNEENKGQIDSLMNESERLRMANGELENQVKVLQETVRTMQIQEYKSAKEIKELTARNQQLETEAVNQSDREQQLQRVVFPDVLLLGDNSSLSAAGTRVFFKQQKREPQHFPTSWIMEPFVRTLDLLTNSSEITASLVKTYLLALQALYCFHINNELPGPLLSQLMSCRKWLTTVCKDNTSILGIALDSTIEAIEQETQLEPWFSASQFDASRMIDSRNSDLPQGMHIIADGLSGVVLVVRGTDVHVLEASDVSMKQQKRSGVQMAFADGVDLPVLQLLPDSWPGYSRWIVLCSWANHARVKLVLKDGEICEPLDPR